MVTPFVGVWIETTYKAEWKNELKRHTLRGCVDWNEIIGKTKYGVWVTPFVGVWIETRPRGSFHFASWSHPSWVCGLKLHFRLNCVLRNSHTLRGCVDWNGWTSHYYNVNIQSHPSWVCGLKLRRDGTMTQHRSHTLRGCVDWNYYARSRRV